MFLKNKKYFLYFFVVIFLFFSHKTYSATNIQKKLLTHIGSLEFFSASFLQNDGENLSEGKIYVGKERIRAEYFSPSKILIILDKDKGMYYNYDLEEDEFFNPKNTNAWFFYDIFRNPDFFENSSIEVNSNEILLTKKGVDTEQNTFLIKVYFESNPLVMRGVELIIDDNPLKLSIYDHNYNEDFSNDFFKLINPKFLN